MDRYGGTHLAGSLRDLLASRHGSTLRGGVLVIASDGWDTDRPEELARGDGATAATGPAGGVAEPAGRRPPGFEPLVGSMAAALPFCDAFLPAHTVRGAARGLRRVTGVSSTR